MAPAPAAPAPRDTWDARQDAHDWRSPIQQGGRHRRHGPVRPCEPQAAACTSWPSQLPDARGKWDEVEEIRTGLATATLGSFREDWVSRVAEEHREVNDPAEGTVRNAERLHELEWWQQGQPEDSEEAKHMAIYRRMRAQHQTVEAFCQVVRFRDRAANLPCAGPGWADF